MECDSSSGTHGYMAMEIYHPDHRHGPPADWFALGVTLHEFATSRSVYLRKASNKCIICVQIGVPSMQSF